MLPSPTGPARHSLHRICARCRFQARRISSFQPARPAPTPRTLALTTTLRSQTPSRQRALFSTASRLLSEPSSEDPAAAGAASRTHYDLFPQTLPDGPPPKGHFPIDVRALRREFLGLQSKHHPDLAPASLKQKAEAYSAVINDAYKTLSNPLTRAQYLLSLRGVDVANDETLKVEEPDLLMMVLEAREEIEEAEGEEQIEELRAVNEERIRESEERLDRLFAGDDVEGAKREAVRLRYWVNVRESLDNWEAGKPVVLQH